MNGTTLQDRIAKGMGLAARKVGSPYVVYRPRGTASPVASQNRVIRLYAAFSSEDTRFVANHDYGHVIWWGVLDSAYTRPGDYLVGTDTTFFVAAQRPILPVQCIKTNATVSISRPQLLTNMSYGGFVDPVTDTLLGDWPAIVLESRAPGTSAKSDSTHLSSWQILLPILPIVPQAADLITDGSGRRFVVSAAEETDLGWRLQARQSLA